MTLKLILLKPTLWPILPRYAGVKVDFIKVFDSSGDLDFFFFFVFFTPKTSFSRSRTPVTGDKFQKIMPKTLGFRCVLEHWPIWKTVSKNCFSTPMINSKSFL